MGYPWIGSAVPRAPDAMLRAAESLGCDLPTVHAVWDVEARASFRPDGSLERRFEPHHMPGSTLGWRDSLKIGQARRDAMLREAHAASPDRALQATSWGGPQIMGFNAASAGYGSASEMVADFAASEDAQVQGFVRLVRAWGLDGALRAHDWHGFARRYNGSGQADVYAARLEAAWRRRSGRPSPEVLRAGSEGDSVRELQAALGLARDGIFGAATEAAVRRFQERAGLPVDGVVGKRTWDALRAGDGPAAPRPRPQPDSTDRMLDRAVDIGGKIGAGAASVEGVRRVLPEAAWELLAMGLVAAGLAVVAVMVLRFARRRA